MIKTGQKKLLIGAHFSISKGLADIFRQADEIECTTAQLFTKSNQQWHAKDIEADQVIVFKNAHKDHDYMPLIVHASYLINIGSPDHTLEKKSCHALAIELKRCELLGIQHLVLHPGAHRNTDIKACLERIAHNLLTVLDQVPGSTMILLETMAGQGTTIGSTFQELGTILQLADYNKRIGICLDTCHVFAAGYDFITPEGYATLWTTFSKYIGKKHLKTIHMNDSVKPCGSHVDRHCDIGKGKIGLEGFRLIMQDTTLDHIPKILETPKTSLEDDARNVATLKKLAK